MNKTYRTVWCEATGTYVAVAENVKARGKRGSSVRMLARATLALAAVGALGAAHADVTIGDSTNPGVWDGNDIAFSAADGRIVFSQGGTITGLSDSALTATSTDAVTGRQVFAVDQKVDQALVAIADASASAVSFNANKTAIDAQNAKITNLQNGAVAADSKEAVTGGQLFSVEQSAQATQTALTTLESSAVTFNAGKTQIDAGNAKITNLQNGSVAADSKEAITGGQLFSVEQSAQSTRAALTALDANTVKFNADKTQIDVGNAKITNAQNGSVAENSKEVVTGGQLYTTNQDVDTINQRLTNLGLVSETEDYTGVKYFRATSTKDDAVASGTDAIAIGPEASAAAVSSLAVGQGASALVTAEQAIVVGRAAEAGGQRAVVVGDAASVRSQFVEDAIALGTGAAVNGDFSSNGTAIGAGASVSAASATALGAAASASGASSVALGAASAQGANALAIGTGAQAHAANDIALGTRAGVNTLGTSANDRTSHIAIGTDAGSSVVGNQTIAMGFEAGSNVIGDQNVAIGSQAGSNVDGDLNVSIGYQANRGADRVDHATAVGSGTSAGRDAVAMGYQAGANSEGSVAVGTQATVTSGQGVAIGKNAVSDGAGVALGSNSTAIASDANGAGYLTGSSFVGGSVVSVGNTSTGSTRRIVNVADGSATHDAVNVGQLRGSQQAVANLVGGGVAVNPNGSFGQITLTDTNNQSHQYNTVVEALGAVTSGQIQVLPADAARYNADGTMTVAAAQLAGHAVNLEQLNESIDANASRYYSVNSNLPGNRDNSTATGANALAIGPESSATGDASTSLGYQAYAERNQATALGHNTNALGANSTAVGNNSFAYGQSGVAMGNEARSQGVNSIVIGTNAQADPKTPNATVDNSVVIGTNAESSANNGIAVGQDALASEVRGIAQGYSAESSATDATAIGSNAHASGVNATASGTRAVASGTSAMALGTDAKGYAESGIAMGQGAQAGKTNLLPNEQADNVDAIAIGTNALADAKNSSAMGRASQATAEQALAVGDGSVVSGVQGSAFGAGNTVLAEQGLAVGAGNSIEAARSSATGNSNTVTGVDSQVVGNSNTVAAGTGGAVGNNNTVGASATGSRVVGNSNTVNVANAFVLGNNSSVTAAGGVAIGSNSASTTGANVAGYVPNTNAGTANNAITSTISTTGAVAVGGNGVRRQITGVAAGSADSDAVNVAQLKATGWNVRTDGDTATHVSTGQGHTVDIGLASEENNMTVTRTSANGQTVIDYALKKNLDLGVAGSVKTGDTLVNNAGVTVGTNVALGNTGLTITNGPSVTIAGISAGNQVITNVAAGVDGTDAVNVDQLTTTEQGLIQKGFALTAADGQTVQQDLGESIEVVGADANVVTTVANGQVQIALGNDINVANNLSVGGTTNLGNDTLVVNEGAVTVGGNTTVDMGGNKVTNVAAGEANTDAVNVGQLNELANKPLTFTADSGTAVERKLGESVAINGSNDNLTTQTTADGVQVALSNNLDLGAAGSVKTGDTLVNNAGVTVGTNVALGNTGLTITNGPSVTTAGISAGDQIITNVAAGVDGTDAVNVDQLTTTEQGLIQKGFALTAADGQTVQKDLGDAVEVVGADANVVTTVANGQVQIALGNDINVANNLSVGGTTNLGNDTLVVNEGAVTVGGNTTVDMGGNKVTNVAAGEANTDAVNVGQLNELANKPLTFTADSGTAVERKLGESVAITGSNDNLTTQTTADGVQVALSNNLDLGTAGSVKTGDTLVNNAGVTVGTNVALGNTGLTITNGPSVTTAGISAGNQVITNVAAGVDGTDAVNVDQLTTTEQGLIQKGFALTAADGQTVQKDLGESIEVVGADANVVTTVANGQVQIALDNDINVANNLSVGGTTNLGNDTLVVNEGAVTVGGNTTVDMGGNKVTNVAAGEANTDAVNVGQLNELANKPLTFTADSGTAVERKLGESVAITGSNDNLTTQTTADGVQVALSNNLDLGAAGSVKTGDTLVNNAGVTVGTNVALGNTGLTIANGPSVTTAGISAGDKTITNVAAGVNDTDAVNVDQLKGVSDVANAGWNLTAQGENLSNVAPNSTVDLSSTDGNIVISKDAADADVKFALADQVNVSNVAVTNNLSVGGTTNLGNNTLVVNEGAVTVGGNTTVDMGGNKVTNVAAGEANTDAVNVGQLNEVANKPLTFTADSGTDLERKLGESVAINGSNDNLTTQTTADGVQVVLSNNLDLGATGSVKTGDTLVNNDGVTVGTNVALGNTGLTIANGPSVTTAGISAGDKTITNVAAGVNGTDAVNVDQLKGVSDVANAGWNLTAQGENLSNVAPNGTVDLSSTDGNIVISKDAADADVKFALADQVNVSNVAVTNNLSVGGTTNLGNNTLVVNEGAVTVGGNTTVDMGGNKITNVAAGEANTDAVNVGQLNELANKPLTFTADSGTALERKLGESVAINGSNDNLTTQTTADGVQVALSNNLDLGAVGSVKTGDTLVNNAGVTVGTNVALGNTGLTIANGPSVTTAGISAGDKTITNVAAGVNGTDAVNVDQLKGVSDVANAGWNLTAQGENLSNVAPNGTVDLSSTDGNIVISKDAADANVKFALADQINVSNVEVTNNLSVGGTTNLGNNTLVVNEGAVTVGGNTTVDMGGNKVTNVAAGEANTDAVNVGQLNELANKPLTFTADSGTAVERKLGESVAITGSNNNLTTQTTADGVQVALSNNLDLGATGSVKTGDTLVNNAGVTVGTNVALGNTGLTIANGPSVTTAGISAGDKTITNVAAGVNGTDAVNVDQLTTTEQNLIQKGFALTAADGQTVQKNLGEAIEVLGADANVVTTVANGQVQIALGDNINVANNLSVAGTTNLGNNALVVSQGAVTIGANTTVDMGGNKITNVAAGVAGTDAVNVDQLKGVSDVANSGWNLTAQGGNLSNVAPGGTVDLSSTNDNIVISKGATDADVTFALSNTLDLGAAGSVKTGDTLVNNAGVTVGSNVALGNTGLTIANGGPSVTTTGINAGNKVITNVAAGVNGTDAVNVDQLTDVANKPLTFTADSGTGVTRKLGESVAINGADSNITTQTTSAGVQIALSKHLDLGSDGSIKLGDTSLVSNGLTIAGGPSVTKSGINAGGKSIINVAAGINNTDAVNVGQLKSVENVARSGWQLPVNGNAAGDQSQVKPVDVVDFANEDGNVLVAKNGHDIKVNLNKDLVADSVTTGDTLLNNDGVKVGNDVQLTAAGLGVGNNVFVSTDGLIAGNVVVSASTGINAGGFKITNVAAGTAPTDAVNVSQLRDVEQSVGNLDDRAVKYDGNKGDPKNSITLEGDRSTDGGKTGGTNITNVAQGEISATSTDAINGAQLNEQGKQIADALGGGSTYQNGQLVTELNVGDTSYNNVNDALNGVNNNLNDKIDNVGQVANAGWQIEANGDGASKVAPGSKVEFVNGDNVQITRETSANGNNTVKVSVSQDIKVNSVTAKEVKAETVTAKKVVVENGPIIDQNGIDMHNKRITNLAAGINAGDAVNMGQLEAATNGLQNQVNQVRGDINRLDNKLSAGIAAAMATAGLPQAYLPGKSMMSIAGGAYNGESAFAIGVSTVSDNGSWVVKMSGNSNSRGDYGGSVGVGYQW